MSAARLEIIATTGRSALAEAVFEQFSAEAVSVLDAGDEPTVETRPNEQPAFSAARVVGLFAAGTDAAPIEAALRDTLGDSVRITHQSIAEHDWAGAWRAHHPPLDFGHGLWVAPKTANVPAGATTVVRLDPGLAFGTGTHSTTALCLRWLAAHDLAGRSVLDYGCGSGVLAIAAALGGARPVVAVDHDPQAVRATADNAAYNGASIAAPPIEAIDDEPAFDVVFANILAQPLLRLAPTLIAHTAPGGQLLLSGLLTRHIEPIRAAYGATIEFDAPMIEHDWVCLVGTRRR